MKICDNGEQECSPLFVRKESLAERISNVSGADIRLDRIVREDCQKNSERTSFILLSRAIPHNYCRSIAPRILRQIVQIERRNTVCILSEICAR